MSISIYKITSKFTDEVYVGRTKQSLKTRFSSHKCNFKRHLEGKYGDCQAKHILKFSDAKISLIEVTTKGEQASRERYWIENTPNCVNKVIPGQTQMEYYWNNPEYRQRQLESKRERNKRPEVRQQRKKHESKPEVKARIAETNKKSRDKCRESRLERRRHKCPCGVCGMVVMKENMRRHQRNKIFKKRIEAGTKIANFIGNLK